MSRHADWIIETLRICLLFIKNDRWSRKVQSNPLSLKIEFQFIHAISVLPGLIISWNSSL